MSQRHYPDSSRGHVSRRAFIRTTVGVAGSTLLDVPSLRADEPRLDLRPGQDPSRVALVQSSMLLDGPDVHRPLLREMLEASLRELTRTDSVWAAWRSLLRDDDVVGLKFNRSGQRMIGTSDAMAEAVVGSLIAAGWSPNQLVGIELPDETSARLNLAPPIPGFDRLPTKFKTGEDEFASVLHQVTALISIPFLKTHNICGLTCSLKNISHAMVKHPARYHEHQCAPFIGDIVGAPLIRDRLRLAIVDALRVVYVDGPVASSHNLADAGGLLLSTDLVAADAVGLAILNDVRKRAQLAPIAASPADIPYLVAAHRAGLGVAAPHGIDLLRIES